jgi:acyl-CoA synthetase (NDP forming)
MVNDQLLNPRSIVIVGGSNNKHKPGGKLLENILNGNYNGNLCVLNPKEDLVQGVKSYKEVKELPDTELAFLAISAKYCKKTVEDLIRLKNTKVFIIISAGFSEEGENGAKLEKEIVNIVNKAKACLIGPNCIGVITSHYQGIFTSPVPKLDENGCDFVSQSGGTAVFIIESALPKGLTFASVYSVGNSAQIGVEEILEYWDNSADDKNSPKIKLLYLEKIRDPDKLLKHASSLIRKGYKIAAIKSGSSEEGRRAALSHTGSLAGSDSAVEALFRKAGIVRCSGREELTTVASILMHKELKGKNLAIITHSGGPAVMLADALSDGGIYIPKVEGKQNEELLSMLNPYASASNPIDLIATGTAEQLGEVIEYCDKKLDYIDGMIVIFGSTGLSNVYDIYEVLHNKIQNCSKPVFPILPSISSAKNEVEDFLLKGHINFPDEVVLGKALTKVYNTPKPAEEDIYLKGVDIQKIRDIIDSSKSGFLDPDTIQLLLGYASIPIVKERFAKSRKTLIGGAKDIGYPLVLKAVGPIHKSEIGGVTLNIKSEIHLLAEFHRMMKIKDVKGVLIQQMLNGIELFIGAKYEPKFGHVILCGLGGIFVEVLKDYSSGLAPLTYNEAYSMIRNLKSYRIIQGTRGQPGINEDKFAEIIVRLSSLLRYATEIKEMDLNPLIGSQDTIAVVDARIRLEK